MIIIMLGSKHGSMCLLVVLAAAWLAQAAGNVQWLTLSSCSSHEPTSSWI